MTYNIALETEQNQRLIGDRAAVSAQVERDTDLYTAGFFDGTIGKNPSMKLWGIEAYRSGWALGIVKFYDGKAEFTSTGKYEKQGHLYCTYRQIAKEYGEISPIGSDRDYFGWSLDIDGLKIEIVTFDWEEPKSEIKWIIYSPQPDSLKFLSEVFGEEATKDTVAWEFGFAA